MSSLRHVMILASAGSGKTYALTNRFVELLAAGASPEGIVALTFTRKAAGEFFDEILHKLAAAARDPAAAQKLAADIGQPTLQAADFLRMLRSVVEAMPRLRLGTLDSFFGRIARAFPLELGLAGEFELLEEHRARFERRRVLQRMFARVGELSSAQQEFIEAFKRATFGAEEKRLEGRLDAFLDHHHEVYLAAPRADRWGDRARIWAEGYGWRSPVGKIADAIGALRLALRGSGANEAQWARWEAFLAALATWSPGAPLPQPLEYILKNALAVWPALRAGRAEMIVDRRKFAIEGEAAKTLAQLVSYVVNGELERQLATTRGIYSVLQAYDAVYHDTVRRAGKLTFADVQRLLLPGDGTRRLGQGAAESAEELRLSIDYRLDGRIEHWLLDEFQDTSFGQWEVLRNLIDEAVQDASGARSFFCVGDVKQAIYSWREGDYRLFRDIFNHYNRAAAGIIAERHLVDSWRSGPALIEMVNAVFGNAAVLDELLPADVAGTWNREWRAHRSALPDRRGQAALLLADDAVGRWMTAVRLLEEIRPLERGLTCAILVQKNETARELADFLRREGKIPAVAESDLRIATDNPLGAALLALVQAAAHPGDTLAWEHVQMSPLGAILADEQLRDADAVSGKLLAQIHEEGFEPTLEYWWKKLEPTLRRDDLFTRMRGQQIAAAAAAFDATGSRNVAEFQQFMADYVLRGVEQAAVVRVMTVHKAKGLGFDVVVLPDLEGTKLAQAREGLAVRKAADRSIEWVLALPAKLFCQHDEVLAAQLNTAEAEAGYEKLALLYVAMTRAKRAMYVITEPIGTSRSHNYARVLGHTLGLEAGPVRVGKFAGSGTWSSGDPDWHLDISFVQKEIVPAGAALSPVTTDGRASVPRRVALRASGENFHFLAAGPLFALDAHAAKDRGTAIHALFAQIEWVGERDELDGERTALAEPSVRSEVLACWRDPALMKVWRRPEETATAEVWRERAFEVLLDDVWVTGVFDRVVVERGSDGRARRATVFDFKTNQISDEAVVRAAAQRYRPQLNLYRRVVAVLLGLPEAAVEAELLFTSVRRLVAVARESR